MPVSRLRVTGMTCSACTGSVSSALSSIEGVSKVDVSLLLEEATIVHENKVSDQTLVECVEDVGFGAEVTGGGREAEKSITTILEVGGMTCSACVGSVTGALQALEGVQSAEVSLMTEEATVVHGAGVSADSLKQAVEDVGFDATVSGSRVDSRADRRVDFDEATVRVSGMTCSSCTATVESQVGALKGMQSCSVALTTEEAHIVYDSDEVGLRTIVETIEDCGFEAAVQVGFDTETQLSLLSKARDIEYWRTTFFKLVLFGVPEVFLATMRHWLSVSFLRMGHGLYADAMVQFFMGTYVQFWLGRRFYISAYKALRHGSGTMDTLICTSTSIIYSYSVFSLIDALFSAQDHPPHLLFDTSTMLFAFVSLGKWAESKAKGNTSTALSKLISLAPSSCVVIDNPDKIAEGAIHQKTIPLELLQKDDICVVLPGSSVPADGTCIFGSSEVDESLLTGESLPIAKSAGSTLIGGSVNVSSTLYMRVEKVGEKTQLSQVVKLVKDAQVAKAPVQRFADAVAAKFVPAVLSLAAVTFLFWTVFSLVCPASIVPKFFQNGNSCDYSKIIEVAISVIVVACPCALGLAAPTAVMVGTGVGASHGILIKGGEVLERTSGVDTIVFDKTGTITEGGMTLEKSVFAGTVPEKTLWAVLYAVEQNSEHPVARAIVEAAKNRMGSLAVAVSEVQSVAGLGVSAQASINGAPNSSVYVGSAGFVRAQQLANESDFVSTLAALRQTSSSVPCSVSHVVVDNQYCGFVQLADTVRHDSAAVVATLKAQGYSVAMVTGDNAATARSVALTVGIPLTNVLAEARPDRKLECVAQLQQSGCKVAFVGDGINDAPALVQADVGIAVATGTDVAMSAADVVLLARDGAQGSSMASVVNALDISARTFSCIRSNFAFAIVYNLLMLPVAMGVFLIPFGIHFHPMLASATMACSSVSVVLNSLRIKRWRPVDALQELVEEDVDVEANVGDSSDLTEFDLNSFQRGKSGRLSSGLSSRLSRLWPFHFGRAKPETYELVGNAL